MSDECDQFNLLCYAESAIGSCSKGPVKSAVGTRQVVKQVPAGKARQARSVLVGRQAGCAVSTCLQVPAGNLAVDPFTSMGVFHEGVEILCGFNVHFY